MKNILYVGNKLSHHGFSPGVIETLGRQLEEAGYKVYYAGTIKNKVLRLLEMLLKTIFVGWKADYIMIDTYSTNAFWFAYMTGQLAQFMCKKYITILHGGDLPERIKRSKKACDLLFLNSYANVAVSGYLQHAFKLNNYSVALIPNGIQLERYPYKIRNSPAPRLLWVRAFSEIYNPLMAVDVIAELIKDYPEASLCMIGPDRDGSVKEFITYASNKGVKKNIIITGKLDREEWIKRSEDYDFFINTTNIDNTPVSVIEAMALGLIIVSTNPGGIPFLLSNNIDSKLVNRNDAKAMAYAIKAIIENPSEVFRLTDAARKKAESFSSKNTISLWLKLLS